MPVKTLEKVLHLYREKYFDFNVRHFHEKVVEDMKISAAEKAGTVLNSSSPDLRSFRANGGRLIQYHGWADAAIAPLGSIEYYNKVLSFFSKYPAGRSGGQVSDFYRLFMVSGMGHCAGGIGPNSFGNDGNRFRGDPERDLITALERWVEQRVAPERFIGTGTVVGDPSRTLTRPICPFPQVARYDGKGDPNAAASFTCYLRPAQSP